MTIALPNIWNEKDRKRIVRMLANMGWRMTREERASLLRLIEDKTSGFIFPHRYDKRYRRIYGYGDTPRKITVSFWRDEDWAVMEQGGRCWLEHKGLRVE